VLTRYYQADQIKENEAGGACGTRGRGERKVYKISVGKPEGKDHLKDQGVDGRMGSEWTVGRLAGAVWSGFTWLRINTGGGLL
jgi:hypothetical protein